MKAIKFLFSRKESKKIDELQTAVKNGNIDLVAQILASSAIDINSTDIS